MAGNSTIFRVPVDQPVAHLKLLIEDFLAVGVEEQVLIFEDQGKTLEDHLILCACGVVPQAEIHLLRSQGALPEVAKWLPFRRDFEQYYKITNAYQFLQDHGYYYNRSLQLRSTLTRNPYQWTDQAHYDQTGEIVSLVVEEYLIETFGFLRFNVPVDTDQDEPKAHILLSRTALSSERLMVFLPMHGTVRAGIWVRGVCVNDDLFKGTYIGYLQEALSQGYGVILLNPNMVRSRIGNFLVSLNKSPADHTLHCYDHVIKKAAAKKIVLVGHGTGGDCCVHLMNTRSEIIPKLSAIVFLDSNHSVIDTPPLTASTIRTLAKGWTAGTTPFGSLVPLSEQKCGCQIFSSGDKKLNWTPHLSYEQAWIHINQQMNPSGRQAVVDPTLEREILQAHESWLSRHTS